ncbi:MAG: hypothetical protein ABIO70_12275 [Pseudomonadota bacterium]
MPERFRPCPECGYAVRHDAPHCLNCGLYLGPPPGLLDRLLGRVRPKRNPEHLKALELRLQEEITRLESQVVHIEEARADLQARVGQARREGRDPAPLREALGGLEEARSEARALVLRQRALLAGVAVERDHNALLAMLAGMEGEGELDAAASLMGWPQRRELLELPGGSAPTCLAWSPAQGLAACLTPFGARLQRLDLRVSPPVAGEVAIPGGEARCLAFDPPGVRLAVGGPGGVRLLGPSGAWVAEAAFPGARLGRGPAVVTLAFGPRGAWLVAGTEKGELAMLSLEEPATFAFGRPVQAVQGFPVRGLAVSSDGLKLWSSGGGGVRLWWVRTGSLVPFSELRVEGAGAMVLSPDGAHLAVEHGGQVGLYESGLSRQVGRFSVPGDVEALGFAADGQRLLVLERGGLAVGSPDLRRGSTIGATAAPLDGAAFSPDGLAVLAVGAGAQGVPVLQRIDLGEGGLVGRTWAAAAGLTRAVAQGEALRAEFGIEPGGAGVRARNLALQAQIEAMVRDAGLAVVYTVTRRAQVAEELTRAGRALEEVGRHLAELFSELSDLHTQIGRALPLAPDLQTTLHKLELLPVSVLRGQVDALLQAVEAVLAGTREADEGALRGAVERLRGLQAHLDRLARLANDLVGPFWGNRERPPLLESFGRLQRELPSWIDLVHARIASVISGRIDAVEESFALDRLHAQRARIAAEAQGADVAAEADWLLENALGHGPLGKDHTEAERRGAQEALDAEWRRVRAETDAFLETQRAARGG